MKMFGSVVPLRAPLLAALFVCAAARANLQSVTAPWTTSEIRPPVLSGRPSPPLATAFVSNAEVPGGQTSSTALPPGQQQIDIGGPAVAGSAEYAGGTYTIRGAGTDIWDTADQFTFVYQPVSGNLEIVSRVASITRVHEWSKVGVMVRESLTAASRHASVFVSAAKGYAFQSRVETGDYSLNKPDGSGAAPEWIKLVRTGNLFEAFRSADGVTWTEIGSDTIAMGETVYVGLAVTSHKTMQATTAVIDGLKITAASADAANQAPAVSLTAPTNGSSFTAPATVTLSAAVSDPENRMASVDFYAGTTLIARDATPPYSAAWSETTVGTFPLTAVAHDADGGTTTSSAVNVTMTAATSNQPPVISLSTGGTAFIAPASITLTAIASDPEGQLAGVEFYNGSTRLGINTAAPYTFSWTSVPVGTYSVTAIAYDAAGASATAAAATIIITAATMQPPTGVSFTASADHATNVTSYRLDVFTAAGGPIASSDLGKPAPDSTGTITVDRAAFFSALAAGNYVATVSAIGQGGETQGGSVAFAR